MSKQSFLAVVLAVGSLMVGSPASLAQSQPTALIAATLIDGTEGSA